MATLPSVPDQTGLPPARNTFAPARILRVIAVILAVVAGALILTATTSTTDYIEYWSSAKLLVHHTDPYSPAGVYALEKAQGYQDTRPIIMLNPPWTLFLIAPLGFLGLRAGLFLWTLATTGCVVLSVYLLNVPAENRAFLYVFAPAVASVFMGQSSAFLLLGFSLFLHFLQKYPFWAGASLLLMAIKPHLFLVFWVVLLADCLYRRRYSIFAGFVSALIAASLFTMYFDPRVWRHYYSMFMGYNIQSGSLPTASMLFRMLFRGHAFWLLFVPSALACIWGLWYYAKKRGEWDWKIQGMLLMLVTILASPYGFFTDEAVLIPCIAFALSSREKRKYSAWILLVVNTIALYIAVVHRAELATHAYIWTPVTWLAWFLYAIWKPRALPTPNSPLENENLEAGIAR